MSNTKEYHYDYLSSEEFDNMFDDEYELWLKTQQTIAEKEAMETDYEYCK
jgi:hypothetical protein